MLVNPVNPFTPLEFGLNSVVNWQEPRAVVDGAGNPVIDSAGQPRMDERWMLGVKWETVCATGSTTASPCITGTVIDVPAKAATWDHQVRGARAFTVYSEIDCSPVGWWDMAQASAAAGLTQSEAYQVERTFQSGTAAGLANLIYPNLQTAGPVLDPIDSSILLQPASTVISGAGVGVDVVEGLGRLEAAIAGCYQGGRPVIHVPIQIAEEMWAQHLLVREGTRLKTNLGSLVAVGSGYSPGVGPGGTTAPAGSGWMYATGAIFGYRGQLRLVGSNRDSLDRSENTLKRIAERPVLLGWDCCLAAVLVTLGGEIAGTFNSAS